MAIIKTSTQHVSLFVSLIKEYNKRNHLSNKIRISKSQFGDESFIMYDGVPRYQEALIKYVSSAIKPSVYKVIDNLEMATVR